MPHPSHPAPRELLKLVVVGHVDHGKSTIVGRLLYDTDSLPEGKLEELQALASRRDMALEWSFVLDAFQAERDQAVTIDTTQIRFKTARRDYVIIDAPGHREFLKNMVSGAAEADAAVLVIDAAEGVREQSRRHGYLLHLLGVRQVAVAINKMDLVDHDGARFAQVAQEVSEYLAGIGVEPAFLVPIAAREGDNVAAASPRFDWYEGPSLLEALDRFHAVTQPGLQPLRLPIQDVYHFDQRRILVGRVESGVLRVGDTVLFSPSNKTARVRSFEAWNAEPPVEAHAGQSVGLTLEEPLFLERGEMLSHPEAAPQLTTVLRATLFWLGRTPLAEGQGLTLKLGTARYAVEVASIEQAIDTDSLERRQAQEVPRDGIAEVVLRSRALIALDEAAALQRTGRFVLLDGSETVGGGLISMEGYPDQRRVMAVRASNLFSVEHAVTREQRWARNRHRGGVIWLTGLSGAGKSTVAMALERRLFERGYHVYVLDGDNVRRGLNANLGFSPDDRAENIRRVGEAAALFADAGAICITAFISPYQSDRDRARTAAERLVPGGFHEVFVAADLETCEKRDPKGLYKRARAGEIEGAGRDEDALAYTRDALAFRNLLLVEQPNGDFAMTMVRQFLFSAWSYELFRRLSASADPGLAAVAAKAVKEAAYHRRHSGEWLIRLGDGTAESTRRAQDALDDLWIFVDEMFEAQPGDAALVSAGLIPEPASLRPDWEAMVERILTEATLSRPDPGFRRDGGRTGRHSEYLGHILSELQFLQRAYPGAQW